MTHPLIDTHFAPEAVVLANGDFPTHPVPLAVLAGARFLCCCDGAAAREGLHPDAIVGDGDSLAPDFKLNYRDILHLESEQDYNDLTKATRYCRQRGFRQLAYLGATGQREDHTLGNISLLHYYMAEMQLDVTMLTDHGYFVPLRGHCRLQTFGGQQVSIFNLTCSRLTGTGLRWQPYAYGSLWQGTLNEALGDEICLDGDGDFMVFRSYSSK